MSKIDFKIAREDILSKISIAAKKFGRNPNDITLTAACKTQTLDVIDYAIASGQKVFGENKVIEGINHFASRDKTGLELRLIGPLQSNKAFEAVELFDCIETLDRDSLANELAKAVQKLGKSPKLLVQVNIGDEDQKSGVALTDFEPFLKSLKIYDLEVRGLMCIPPNNIPAGPYFALLQKLAKNNGLCELSMGMSSDFEAAIMFGATHIRIGTALFGHR